LFEIFSGIGAHEFGDQMRDEVARNEADSKVYDIEAEVRNAPAKGRNFRSYLHNQCGNFAVFPLY
jgi:hypothetical protein